MDMEDARGPIPAALKRFIWDIQSMVELADSEREILLVGRDLMARLLASADWLPASFSEAQTGAGRQFQIYSDAMERFCVVSTVLAGGAGLEITQPGSWEIMGLVSGAIDRRPLHAGDDACVMEPGMVETLRSGSVDALRVVNSDRERSAIAMHVYGGGIDALGRRLFTADGTAESERLLYANPENAPPYDIFSIQTQVLD